ncbi:PD40 domain-containing protein [Methanoculleus thermophilus]|jgi:beta propeller repeat protein|uniref:Beta propeller repeat-containing protein n=1 Tax=Methanoculleus thermophilus TaxID=2200 RepID=A0A1G8WUC6_9EURY|nr:PD40 domain-containing protein [Methanoculleus thermophilus]NLN08312.1 hypothetical protein [Methanoculleus thermophilus]SDJ81763.1 beta propeller repeat-containing protein [Methanoculleus thermophilus]HQD25044.1 PD40 domain-containing protein [Methanoculleus thermophilus]
MSGRNLRAPILSLIVLALFVGAATAAEHQITNATVDQVYATVLDDRILWSDNRTGDYDVYLYNLTEASERVLSPPETDQFATALPAGMMMSGDRIVWEDNRSGNRDIYLYDLTTGEETRITNGSGHEVSPAIAGDWIVWQDDRNDNWDIYLYDIATGEETRITTNESAQMSPAVTESMIVWNDYRNGNWDIYAWTPDEAAPSAPGPAEPPAPPAPGVTSVPEIPSPTNATTTLPPGETPTATQTPEEATPTPGSDDGTPRSGGLTRVTPTIPVVSRPGDISDPSVFVITPTPFIPPLH